MPDVIPEFDPRFDLVLERVIKAPPELVWRALTEPELLQLWFTPRPWTTAECVIDLRPGGAFRTLMRSPDGADEMWAGGSFLEIAEPRRLIWTTVLLPGFRPSPGTAQELPFTAVITFEPRETGTLYRCTLMHRTEDVRNSHEQMGFREGWGAAVEQLAELVESL